MRRMRRGTVVSSLAMIMTLTACGGGGGGGEGVASTPPPPPAPAGPASASLVSTSVDIAPIASPATRPGKVDAIALIDRYPSSGSPTSRLAGPSEVKITTYQTGPSPNDISYSIEFASSELPGNKSTLTGVMKATSADVSSNGSFTGYRDGTLGKYPIRFGDRLTVTNKYSDGTQKTVTTLDNPSESSEEVIESIGPDKVLWYQLAYNVGLSHVSLGEWMWKEVTVAPDGRWIAVTDEGDVYFVHGDRTPAGAIPTSGTATYSAASLHSINIAFTADFGQRSMSAQLNRDYSMFGDSVGGYTTVPGVDLHGTGSISSPGGFSIPLAGSVANGGPSQPATGSLDGAFYGPQAEQLGGVIAVGQTPGSPQISDAFVGTRN